MSGLEITALLAVAAWLAVLSVVAVLGVRQIAILTLRVERTVGFDVNEDGLPIGFDVPAEVAEALPETRSGVVVLLMSATCGPCRDIAAELPSIQVPKPLTVLLTGPDEPRAALAQMLLPGATVIEDPEAARLAGLLNIKSSPFALNIAHDTVVGKAYLAKAQNLERLFDGMSAAAGNGQPDLEVIGSAD